MPPDTITLQVDSNSAQAFAAASVEDRRKMQLLLNLRLRELTAGSARPLNQIMDEIGQYAADRGLTSGTLETLLRDEGLADRP